MRHSVTVKLCCRKKGVCYHGWPEPEPGVKDSPERAGLGGGDRASKGRGW